MSTKDAWQARWDTVNEEPKQGGQGTIRKVRAISGPPRIAVLKDLNKPKDPERRTRFIREVAALRSLSIPGIPRLIESNASDASPDDKLYLIMEFVEGPTLLEFLETRSPLSIDEARRLLGGVATILAGVHAQGYGHRDLKPDNIIVPSIDNPVLVDFGQTHHSDDAHDMLTAPPQHMGNRFFTMPGLEYGDNKRDVRWDIAQWGALLFYSLTKIDPGSPRDSEGLMPQERTAARGSLARFPNLARAQLELIFATCFQLARRRTTPTMTEISALLTDLARPISPILALPRIATLHIRAAVIKRRSILAAGVATVLSLPLAATFALRLMASQRDEQGGRDLLTARSLLESDPTAALVHLKTVPVVPSLEGGIRMLGEDAFRRGIAWRVFNCESFCQRGRSASFFCNPSGTRFAVLDDFGGGGVETDVAQCITTSASTLSAIHYGDGTETIKGFSDGRAEWTAHATSVARTKVPEPISRICWGHDGWALLLTGSGAIWIWRRGDNHLEPFAPLPEPSAPLDSIQTLSLRLLPRLGVVVWATRRGRVTTTALGGVHKGAHRTVVDMGAEIRNVEANDGNTVLAWSARNGRVARWNMDTDEVTICRDNGSDVCALTVTPDGDIRALCRDGELLSYPPKRPRPFQLTPNRLPVIELSDVPVFSKRGDLVAVGRASGAIEVYDWNIRRYTFKGHSPNLRGLEFVDDDQGILSADSEHAVRAWRLTSPDWQMPLRPVSLGPQLSPDRSTLAAVTIDGLVIIRVSDVQVRTSTEPGHKVQAAHWTADSREFVFTSGRDIRIWRQGTERSELLWRAGDDIAEMAISSDRSLLAFSSVSGSLHIVRDGAELRAIALPNSLKVHRLAINSNGHIVAGCDTGELILLRHPFSTPETRTVRNGIPVMDLAFSSDPTRFITLSGGVLSLSTLGSHTQRVLSTRTTTGRVGFSGGNDIVWAEQDRTAMLWNGHDTKAFNGVSYNITCTAVDESGSLVAAGCSNGSITLWDVRSSEHRTVAAHTFDVRRVWFAENGRVLISYGGEENSIILWKDYLPPDGGAIHDAIENATNFGL